MHSFTINNLISCFLIVIILLIFDLGIVRGQIDTVQLIERLNTLELQTEEDLVEYRNILFKNQALLSLYRQEELLRKGYDSVLELNVEQPVDLFAFGLARLYDSNSQSNSDLDSALYYYQIFLDSAIKTNRPDHLSNALNIIGNVYYQKGEVAKAIEYFNKAIESYKQAKMPEHSAYVLSNLSNLYFHYGDVNTAIKYTKEGLALCDLLSPSERAYNLIYKYSSLINYYETTEQLDSSFHYLKKGESIIESLDSFPLSSRDITLSFTYHSSCINYYLNHNDIANAKLAFNQITTNPELSSADGVLMQLRYYTKLDSIQKVENLINNASELITDTTSVYWIDFLRYRGRYFERTGEYQQALSDIKTVTELEFIRKNEEKLEFEKLVKYQLITKESENKILLLEKDNSLKSLLIKIVSIGIIIALLVTFFMFRQFNLTKKKNAQLEAQSKIIDTQAKTIKNEADAKEVLFTNISHELRTPLMIISGAIQQLLSHRNRGKNEMSSLELIANGSNQLRELTDQILDIIKYKFTPIKPLLSSFQPDQLIEYLEQHFSAKAKQQNLTLIFKNHENTVNTPPLTLVTDVGKLLTICKNLIFNALKYSKGEGTIIVSLNIEDNRLKLSVQDQGQGIAEEDIPFIFDRFYQSTGRKSLQGGVGIGLAIIKNYAEILQGTISVESKENVGSTFFVDLPVEFLTATTEIKPYPFPEIFSQSTPPLPKIQSIQKEEYLLIVEDNNDLCQYLWQSLKDDYQLSFAHNGKEAISQIEIKQPKVIITDWMMRGMNGKELIAYLKTNEAYTSIPILMMTARNSLEDRQSILRIGVDNYITKPFAPESLLNHIDHLTKLAENRENMLIESAKNESSILKGDEIKFLKTLEKIIAENISNFDFTLADVVQELNISLRQLNRKVKQLTGLTPKQYVNEIRFQEAKRMLEEKEYDTVKAVTFSVGFKSEQYFSRNFKARFGKYPKDILYV